MPVFGHSVTSIPDIHELARSLKATLWLSYHPGDFLDKETQAYLKRYKRIKGVRVFKLSNRSRTYCPAIPKIFIDRNTSSLLKQIF